MNCNFFCKHCGSSAGRKTFPGQLSTVEIIRVFREIGRDFYPKNIMIAVTGGEPLVRKDLFEVMKYASHLGFYWGMVTNGYLVNPDVVRKMKETSMNTISISIDGIGQTHDSFRNMKKAYDHAISAVRLLVAARFLKTVQITTVVHRGNISQLEEMYRIFSGLGIDSWRVINVDPIGRAETNRGLLLKGSQFKYLLDFIKSRRESSKFEVTYGCSGFLGLQYENEVRNGFFICRTGIDTASILYNGDIFVCPNVERRKEFIQGNVRHDRFSEIWNNKFKYFRLNNRTANTDCLKCEFWEDCLGGPFHLWDSEKSKPKFCHTELLKFPN